MKKYRALLNKNELFINFSPTDLESVLKCLSAEIRQYTKNDIVLKQGQPVRFIGIVLSGAVQVINEDINGNLNIISHLGLNSIFAEALAYAGVDCSPITVKAAENCEILLVDCKKIVQSCNNACVFHLNLIENMLSLIARKNVALSQKMEILSQRTIREKLLAYFNMQVQINNSKTFLIPYNRESLAFYLCVDRSALSRELSKMQKEGLIRFNKSEFEVL